MLKRRRRATPPPRISTCPFSNAFALRTPPTALRRPLPRPRRRQVLSCKASGGVGTLAYPGPSLSGTGDCGVVPGSLITHDHCEHGAAYPPAVGITRGQGLRLAALLAGGADVTVRIELPREGAYGDAYGLRSGTSMATPVAAAAAGLVWAARPGCNSSEVRAALAAAALDLGPPGRDEFFGWGLVQIQPAIDYLGMRPCGRAGAATASGDAAAATGGPRHSPHAHHHYRTGLGP